MKDSKNKDRSYKIGHDNYEIPEKTRVPGERLVIHGRVDIDYGCFKKTPEEKLRLKLAKAQAKGH